MGICKKYLNIWGVVLRGEKPDFTRRKKVIELLQTLMTFKDFYNSTNYFFITKYFCYEKVICRVVKVLESHECLKQFNNFFSPGKVWFLSSQNHAPNIQVLFTNVVFNVISKPKQFILCCSKSCLK